jgi:hypothetical protein
MTKAMRFALFMLLLPLAVTNAQKVTPVTTPSGKKPVPASVKATSDTSSDPIDTSHDVDDDGAPLGLQFGIATGALSYAGGRSEQGLGVIARWAPARWLSISATPSAVRVATPANGVLQPAATRSGITDLPLELTLTHPVAAPLAPTLSVSLGTSLPVGDTLGGFGAGRTSFSTSASLGFTPREGVWANVGAGKSLSGVSPQSALMTGSGWGDASIGTELTNRLSVSAGYSSDLGTVDSTFGRSRSVEGGIAARLQGHETLHLNLSRGISGASPRWSVGLAFGTAFPYLNHLGAGSSLDQVSQALGGGTHGLGTGKGTSALTNRGRGKG